MNLDQMLASMTGAATQRQQLAAQTAQAYGAETQQLVEMSTVNMAEAQAAAQQAQQIAGQEAAITNIQNQAAYKASQLAGFDPNAMEDEYSRSIATYNQAEQQRLQARQQYDTLTQTDLLSNPIGYIMAQLQLPTVAATVNNLVDARDAAAGNIAARKQMINDYKSGAIVDVATQTRQVALDRAQNAYQIANIKIREAEMANLSALGTRRMQEYQLQDKTFDIQSDMMNKVLSVEQWKMQRAQVEEARAARVAETNRRLTSEKEGALERAALNDRLATLSASMGMPAPMSLEGLKLLPQASKERWINAALNGSFGADVRESLAFLAPSMQAIQQTNPAFAASANRIANSLQSYQAALGNDVLAGKIKSKDVPEEAVAKYMADISSSANVSKSGNGMLAARHDTVYNPLKVEGKAMLRTIQADPKLSQALADNVLVKALGTVAKTDPLAPIISAADEQIALKSVAQSVLAGTVNIEKASKDIASYYQLGSVKQRETTNYTLMGIPRPSRYLGTIESISFWGDPVEMDLSDPMAVKLGLNKMIKASASGARTGTGFGARIPGLN